MPYQTILKNTDYWTVLDVLTEQILIELEKADYVMNYSHLNAHVLDK